MTQNEHPGGTLPRIWYSRLPQTTDFNISLDNFCHIDDKTELLKRKRVYQRWELWSGDYVPDYLFFAQYRPSKIPAAYCDAFKIIDAYITVSPKLRDVLVQFDLGKTRLFEVPIFETDGKTPSPYPPHYILNIAETKTCFVPEQSENVEQAVAWDATEPEPDAPWKGNVRTDMIAVRASAAEGVNLWADPILRNRIFFSDRLKRAIDDAGVTKKGLEPIAAKVLG